MWEFVADKFLSILAFTYRRIYKNFLWSPTEPMKNKNVIKNISEYPKNYEIDFENNRIGNIISGEKSFVQTLQKFILTERNKYKIYPDSYGIEEAITIFETKDVEEFSRQSYNIAVHIMEEFSEWIEQIYKIHRKKNTLIIEIKAKGKPDTIKCNVLNIHIKMR